MKLKIQTPVEALKTTSLKFTPLAADVEKFARNLGEYRVKINSPGDEEHLKLPLRDLLSGFFTPTDHYINTKGKQDSSIYLGKDANSNVGVIFETKMPRSADMIRVERLNVKAFHQLILYYFEERIIHHNTEIKRLVATDFLEFFVFDANTFDRQIYGNPTIKKLFDTKINDKKDKVWFYSEISSLVEQFDIELPCIYFSLDEPEKLNKTTRTAIFKVLSPQFLLKQRPAADSNALNKPFYDELLHIIGLAEKKDGKKIKIVRLDEAVRKSGSLLELTISKLRVQYPCNLTEIELTGYGDKEDDRIFQIAFELCLTWINRILFLKLLEAQLVRFHPNEKDYTFLNIKQIDTFDKLYDLFHHVLAVKFNKRDKTYSASFERVPYLNSSLFELAEIERKTLTTSALGNDVYLPYANRTVLKDRNKAQDKLATLPYLFAFLDSYDYTSVTRDQLEVSDDRLINSSILGKIFEKINGYKDGSIYTPGFITMYMCREAIRPAVVGKFNELKGWDIKSFEGLRNKINQHNEPTDILEFNGVIDQLRICDPAVGSGHFLVSALNELIVIKHELGLLADETGRTFGGLKIAIEDDELRITDAVNQPYHYEIINGEPLADSQRLQRTLFHQKQTIIENCLFGVDINPNSVAICRLRLWIELLKHSYYKAETRQVGSVRDTSQSIAQYTELETLPNIDINIQQGNSLLSEYPVKDGFASPHASGWIRDFVDARQRYREETDKAEKIRLLVAIDDYKRKLKSQLPDESYELKRRIDKQLAILAENQNILFHERSTEEKELKIERVQQNLKKLNEQLDAEKRKYDGAFEWRYEFPEVLDESGNFKGFDAIIGNPPYIRQEELSHGTFKKYLRGRYQVFAATADIYVYFYELGLKILKPKSPLCFITANKFMRSGYGRGLRKLLGEYHIQKVIDFGDMPVFDGVVTYPAIVIVENSASNVTDETSVLTMTEPELTPVFDKVFLEESIVVPVSALNENIWRLEHPAVLQLIEKLEVGNATLEEVLGGKIYLGIKTGLNEAFVIPAKVRDKLVASDPNCEKLMKPIMRGSDLSRWRYRYDNSYLIQLESSQNVKHPWSGLHKGKAEMVFAETYPSVFEHFSEFREKLANREDQGDYFWELRSCSYWKEFNTNKIIYPDIYEHQSFALDTDNYLLTNTCYFMPNAPTWLVALLNSRIVEFYYSHLSTKMRGGYLRAFTDSLKEIPIPEISDEAKDQLTAFYNEITFADCDIYLQREFETKLDDYVADLFDLSHEQRDAILTGEI